MEEVPAHVHPGAIVPDVLSRQHEHRSSLILSGDRETCYTDLQCRRFRRNLFQCYSTTPRRLPLFWIQGEEGTIGSMDPESVTGSETDDDLILRARRFIFLLIGGHMLPDFAENLVHAVVHGGFGRCTTDWGALSVSSDLGVVAYTYIAASADDGDSGRPSCSSWRNMVCTTIVRYPHLSPPLLLFPSFCHLLFSSFPALVKYNNSSTARPQLFSRTIIWLQGRQNSSSREPSLSKDNNSSLQLLFPLSISQPFSKP
ncbi:hypothetical protein M9H77_13610 [Catharanthus roseus]|uniref:Uncharacterized protein n=1 Tax=Catharanthus roseus TaxID=4058 RepID=A0ACC0BKP7_CATRO|nr:hypothetical protein M9H77_13610 [Catharanthus roseus]